MNLTNQELIQELQKRIQNNSLGLKIKADEVSHETKSLLSHLKGKDWLILTGLIVTFTLVICYSVKVTSNRVASCEIELDDNPPITLNLSVEENHEKP